MSGPTIDLIDQIARRVERTYLWYQTSLRALIGDALDHPNAHLTRVRSDLAASVRDAQLEVLETVKTQLLEGVDQVDADADQAVGMEMDLAARKAVVALQEGALATAAAQLTDAVRVDGTTVMSLLHKLQLKASMRAAQGTDPKIAFDLVKAGAVTGLTFTRLDRAGKAWSTSIYARTVARALMVNTYTQTFLMSLLSNGIDTAVIEGDEGPIVFSSTGETQGLPTLDEIQAEYLHPNASRLVSK